MPDYKQKPASSSPDYFILFCVFCESALHNMSVAKHLVQKQRTVLCTMLYFMLIIIIVRRRVRIVGVFHSDFTR